MSVTFTEEEREVLLELVKSINPREDVLGVLLYTGVFRKLKGERGAVNLAEKLERSGPLDPRCPGCGSAVVNNGDECHSCRNGSHDPEDKRWLTKYQK
jgi:hypothetical protein